MKIIEKKVSVRLNKNLVAPFTAYLIDATQHAGLKSTFRYGTDDETDIPYMLIQKMKHESDTIECEIRIDWEPGKGLEAIKVSFPSTGDSNGEGVNQEALDSIQKMIGDCISNAQHSKSQPFVITMPIHTGHLQLDGRYWLDDNTVLRTTEEARYSDIVYYDRPAPIKNIQKFCVTCNCEEITEASAENKSWKLVSEIASFCSVLLRQKMRPVEGSQCYVGTTIEMIVCDGDTCSTYAPSRPNMAEKNHIPNSYAPEVEIMKIPDDMRTLWAAVNNSTRKLRNVIFDSCNEYRAALDLWERYPLLAYVSFVSAIDMLAHYEKTIPEASCENECPHCGKKIGLECKLLTTRPSKGVQFSDFICKYLKIDSEKAKQDYSRIKKLYSSRGYYLHDDGLVKSPERLFFISEFVSANELKLENDLRFLERITSATIIEFIKEVKSKHDACAGEE